MANQAFSKSIHWRNNAYIQDVHTILTSFIHNNGHDHIITVIQFMGKIGTIEGGHCHPRLLIFPAPNVPHKVVCLFWQKDRKTNHFIGNRRSRKNQQLLHFGVLYFNRVCKEARKKAHHGSNRFSKTFFPVVEVVYYWTRPSALIFCYKKVVTSSRLNFLIFFAISA